MNIMCKLNRKVMLTVALLIMWSSATQSARAMEDAEICKSLHPRMTRQDVARLGFSANLEQLNVRVPIVNGVGCSIRMSDDLTEISEINITYDRPRGSEPEVREYAISLLKQLMDTWGVPAQWTVPYYYNAMDKLTGGITWTCTGAYRDATLHQVSFEIHDGMLRTIIHSSPCLGALIPEYQTQSRKTP